MERRRQQGNPDQIMDKIPIIPTVYDGCQQFFYACSDYASNIDYPLDDYKIVKYSGAFGGSIFRGGYYLRGKAYDCNV